MLKDAVSGTPTTKHVDLLLENATYFINARLEYDGGPRSPHLERAAGSPDVLANVVAPRAKASASGGGN